MKHLSIIISVVAGGLLATGVCYYINHHNNQEIWQENIAGEVIDISKASIEGEKLEADLNYDGNKEIVFQQNIGAANGIRLIISDRNGKVLYSTLARAGSIKIENSKVVLKSSIEGIGEEGAVEINWNGKKWHIDGDSLPYY